MADNFADRLMAAIREKSSRVCVGIDPVWEKLPAPFAPASRAPADAGRVVDAVRQFAQQILVAVAPSCVAAKFNSAFFERLAPTGLCLLTELVSFARGLGLLTIADSKRADVGSTAEAYAQAAFGAYAAADAAAAAVAPDAVTVNPYLGSDSVLPFIRAAVARDAGVFVLVRTSNPSAAEIQDLVVEGGQPVYRRVADLVSAWGGDYLGASGYSSVGAVVGATWPRELSELRQAMPHTPFLVPGYGAQGGGAADVVGAFDAQGMGGIVSSSRGIIYCSRGQDFAQAAAQAAEDMRVEINRALGM